MLNVILEYSASLDLAQIISELNPVVVLYLISLKKQKTFNLPEDWVRSLLRKNNETPSCFVFLIPPCSSTIWLILSKCFLLLFIYLYMIFWIILVFSKILSDWYVFSQAYIVISEILSSLVQLLSIQKSSPYFCCIISLISSR